ncbi:MAG TPA: TonB-dependent receptor [Terracidiphilus sp.]|nr:TonB-dependent receptor [Terracidiphilus sp.]
MVNSSFGIEKKSPQKFYGSLLIAFLLVASAIASGQGYFGTVSGTLTDPSGAVISGAKITLVDQNKGYKFSATSDSEGRYLYRSVSPGLYTVIAQMTGFEKVERTNIRVNVGENPTADLTLKVASSTETVEVNSQNQTIDSEDATTGLVVNRNFIDQLPLVDRYVMDLVMLTPGVTEADDQCSTGCTGTNFVSNGSRNSTADVLMDGATVTNYEPNGGVTQVTYTPSPEAVDEFRVEQSNFSAEYGFSGASVVNMITRSGTNSFHGSAYDFIRNTLTDANNWFNDQNGIPLPPVHRNNFGGTIGGPIFKNKTFFFFDYDGTRQSSAGTYQAGVPTEAERTNADFGEVCTAQGGTFDNTGMCTVAAGQLWDPYTGVFVANDQGAGAVRSGYIPYNNIGAYTSPGNPKLAGTPYQLPGGVGNLIDPVAKQLMNLFPMPNPNMASPTIYDNWIGSGAGHYPNDQWDLKIDHRFSEKNLLSAKYSHEWNSAVSYNCFGNFADPCAGGPNQGSAHLFTLNDTQTITQTLLVTATLGFTRGAERISAYNGAGGVTDPLNKLGFPEYLNSNGFMGVPAMFIDQSTYYSAGYTNIGGDPYGNYKQGQDTGQLTIAVSKVIGNHDLKFGFEGRLHQMNYIQTNAPNGIFSFDRSGSSQCPYDFGTCGGDGMASFLMGQMANDGNGGTYYEIQDQPATEDHQYAWYAQENWKVDRKLTLNMGLRYDVSMPRTDRHNRQNWLDLNVVSPLVVPALGTLHGGEVFASSSQRTIVNDDWKDIQPRFGFAYQIWPLTVIRGGYGIYYSQPRSGATGVAPYGSQGFNQYTNAIVTYNNDGATPYLHLSNPYPNGLIQPPGNSLGLMNDVGYGANGPLRSMTNTPYEQSWSFGVEHQFPWNVILNVIYAGKKGTHLYFSGANYINHLGPEVEGYSADQINNLTNMVDNPFYGIITDPNSYLSSPQIQELYLELPYPQFPGGVTTDAWPIANSTYHSLQLVAEKRYSNGLQFLATYVWSKSIDDSSVPDDNTTWLGSFTSLQDPNKPWLERSLSTFDIPQVFQLSYTYDLPWGRGKALLGKMPAALDAILGGWKTNGVWRVNGGRPLAFSTYDGTSIPTYGGQRPNLVGKPKRTHGSDSTWINAYISNPDSLVLPPVYTLGNTPRATGLIRSPLAFNTNLSVNKDFSLARMREGMTLELRLEAENALNHPVFGTPDTSVDDPNFGIISYTANSPRQVQLGMKFTF